MKWVLVGIAGLAFTIAIFGYVSFYTLQPAPDATATPSVTVSATAGS
jgi:hypothetical protein